MAIKDDIYVPTGGRVGGWQLSHKWWRGGGPYRWLQRAGVSQHGQRWTDLSRQASLTSKTTQGMGTWAHPGSISAF